ncbi:hypothetical protein Drorol1_Dr00021348 [Drosera rotundifolia]
MMSLILGLLPQPSDCALSNLLECVGTTRLDFSTLFASPNTNSLPLHRILKNRIRNIRQTQKTLSDTDHPRKELTTIIDKLITFHSYATLTPLDTIQYSHQIMLR